jgi:lysophospholipase L1-like esterase
MTRRLAIVAAAVAGLAGLGCAACTPAVNVPPKSTYGAITHTWTGTGPKVAILGDSITVAAWGPLYRNLATDHAVKIAAWWGEGFDGGAFSDRTGTTMMVDAATEYASDPPAVVVSALGTNTVWNAGGHVDDVDTAIANEATAIASFPDACLVRVTIPETSPATGWNRDTAARLNAMSSIWADVTVDWAGAVAGNPALVSSDGVHTTATGTVVRAQMIADAVRACDP